MRLWLYHDRLIAIDLSGEKELDGDPKAIQQIGFVGQLKNIDGINADGTQNQEVRVKLKNTELNKLKSAVKNRWGATLRLNNKNFEDKELPPKLFPTLKQTPKIRNVFANNMSTYVYRYKT